ncbi:uncharacterized protein DNG_09135 [Cephalotrichum gorgonifer]|uniref:Rhodopsin domain-containing protein n=1 Tax=Cephalotrichum gorgonifer TaxID=2041049 RepID=A0AAE8N7X8_9PEZI|nr:uncharacterized protein DNG_09135 [Cephalotrichum gorgonifer]
MVFHNPILVPRQVPPPDPNAPPIIYTDPDDVPMFTPLTPEQYAALPHPNYGPKLLTTIWVLLGLAAVFLALRLYCKFTRHRGTWWDDWLLIGSFLCLTAECACLTQTTEYGYGRYWYDWTIIPEEGTQLLILINAAGSCTLTASIWSKTSFALTLLRLVEGKMKWLIWYIIISMNIGMGLSALFNWVQCTPVQKTWLPLTPGTCWDPNIVPNYNIFSSSYSAAMDIVLAMLPWTVIWGLQMKKKEKIGVAVAMSCGIFAGITAIVKTTKIPAMKSANPGPAIDLYIWGNAESCVTIIAACIPILRVFVRDVKTSAAKYYLSNENHSTHGRTQTHQSKVRDTINTVTITGGRGRGDEFLPLDDDDESRLTRGDKIMQTKEVAIAYEDGGDSWSDGRNEGHEMNELRRPGHAL